VNIIQSLRAVAVPWDLLYNAGVCYENFNSGLGRVKPLFVGRSLFHEKRFPHHQNF
jgi:hypothetical protein